MNFKNTLVKCIAAVICVVIASLSMVSAVGDYATAKIEAANGGSGTSLTDDFGIPSEDSIADEGSIADGEYSTDAPIADDDTTQAPADGNAEGDAATDDKKDEASKPADGDAKPAEPKTPIEVLNYYNVAVNKAVSSKVGYNKTRTTDNESMEGSVGLQAMKSLVYKFMGIGAENAYTEVVQKGNWGDRAYLFNSKLAATDVTAATISKSGDNYNITLKLKSGSSSASQSNPTTPANAALDKCGICVGAEDKGYFDHKTASVIYDAIAGTYAGAEVKEGYTNATVKATVNATTGNLVSLVVEWNQSVTLSKLLGMSATATGISHVTYKDFKY